MTNTTTLDTTSTLNEEPDGWQTPRSYWGSRMDMYAPTRKGAPSTTRQAEVLNTATLSAPTTVEGVLIGEDTLTLRMVAWDPVTAYYLNLVESPNVVVLGAIGQGKSALLKTCYLLRPYLLSGVRFVVIDKKPNSNASNEATDEAGEGPSLQGEYTATALAVGVTPIRLQIGGGGSRINLLDPALTETGGSGGTLGILTRAGEMLNDGIPLSVLQRKTLRESLQRTLTVDRGRPAELQDLIDTLYDYDPGTTHPTRRPVAVDALALAALEMAALLEQLVVEMPGLFDGPTSDDVRLDQKLTVFDINALPEDGPAIPLVMMMINVWVLGTIRELRRTGQKVVTYFVVDEGWFLVGGPMGKVIRSNAKLSRGLGLVNVVGLHHVSDIPDDDPAVAFIKDAGTMHLYRQERRDDAEAVERIAGLQSGTADELMDLPKGTHLLKRGRSAEVRVRHVLSAIEERLINTDGGMATSINDLLLDNTAPGEEAA